MHNVFNKKNINTSDVLTFIKMRAVLTDKMFISENDYTHNYYVFDLFRVRKITIKFSTFLKLAPSNNASKNMGALQNCSLKKRISELLSLKYT